MDFCRIPHPGLLRRRNPMTSLNVTLRSVEIPIRSNGRFPSPSKTFCNARTGSLLAADWKVRAPLGEYTRPHTKSEVIPEGCLKLAQRFNVGSCPPKSQSPEGTAESRRTVASAVPSGLVNLAALN